MYLALARKYRPQSFSEVVGQDAVIRTLANAIAMSRVHHAYLFCGARGVGKTSLARIFAKSLNCEKGPTPEPCQTCPNCEGITRSNSMDVVEIDAASHTGVDDVRELIEQVKFLPGAGKYRIYIIDEVHMLSKSAFNALLKTLEEPPSHVIFILATTDPHKVPVTILSRCQRFDFRKMPKAILAAHLRNVLASEAVTSDEGAIDLVAECAQGSVRDAMSLLDQVISASGKEIQESQVRASLGLGARLLVQEMLTHVVSGNLEGALANLKAADEDGLDLKIFSEDILKGLRGLILTLATQKAPVDISPSESAFLLDLAKRAELSTALVQFQILFQGVQDAGRSEFPLTLLEIVLVKLMRASEMAALADLVTELKDRAERKGPASVAPQRAAPVVQAAPMGVVQTAPNRVAPPTAPRAVPGVPVPAVSAAPHLESASANNHPDWAVLVAALKQTKPMIAGLLAEAVPMEVTAQRIEVGYGPSSANRRLVIERKSVIEDFLQSHFGRRVEFVVSETDAEKKKP